MTSNWIDFKELRARVSLADVMFELYGIDTMTQRGDRLVGPCPVHGGDSPRAFHADLKRNIWHCFSQCAGGGNQLDFVAQKEGISIRDAAVKLQAHFAAVGTSPTTTPSAPQKSLKVVTAPKPSPSEGPITKENPPLKLELQLKGDHPHLVTTRKLSPETIEHFDVGYCSRGIMRGCIAIPVHDEHGALVAYAGRRLKPADMRQYGKYKLPTGFHKELVLYNWHRLDPASVDRGVIVVEGFFAVMALHQAGLTATVATMGVELSDHQAELLAQAGDVVVLFDGNEAGRRGADKIVSRLKDKVIVRVGRLPDDTAPDDLSPRALRWLVNGMRELDLTEVSFWGSTPETETTY